MTASYRVEKDSLGEMQVPSSAYYGAQTQRAVENFPISGLRFPRRLIQALGWIKASAAEANLALGYLDARTCAIVVEVAEEVAMGSLDEHFPIDIYQTGSGTSSNMNANEVISNRAIEKLGGRIGSKTPIHPNDHVNMGQSSNDVIPTAIHVAAWVAMTQDLLPALERLALSLDQKSVAFDGIVKTGRTHLQDATPVRLGQEFAGYAAQIRQGIRRLRSSGDGLCELALGGTAVGTGINRHPDFPRLAIEGISRRSGESFREAADHFEAQSAQDAASEASGALKTLACSLMKIANDIRWMASGPRAGIFELELPTVQPGSSIMPGKVNPVIAESVCMVAAQVIGNDTAITIGCQSGNFELNVMLPVIAHNLLGSISLLAATADNFRLQCIDGLKANREGCEGVVERGLAICTALAPSIGYDKAASLSKEAYKTGRTIRELAREQRVLPEAELEIVLDARAMTHPGVPGGGAPQGSG